MNEGKMNDHPSGERSDATQSPAFALFREQGGLQNRWRHFLHSLPATSNPKLIPLPIQNTQAIPTITKRYTSANRKSMVENRLEKILEDKAYVFTSCFAPMNCSAFGPMDDCDPSSSSSNHREDVQTKQNDAFLQMGTNVKKHVAQFVAPRDSSLMRDDDDDDEALLTELEAQVHELNFTGNNIGSSHEGPGTSIEFEIADSGSISELNTISEQTWEDIENSRSARGENLNSGRVLGNNINATNNRSQVTLPHLAGKHLAGSYKQSIRSKFEYYRQHQSFVPTPRRKTTGNKNATMNTETVQTGVLSHSYENKGAVATQKPTFAPLQIEPNDNEVVPSMTSPQSRRNELARKILQRRQALYLQSESKSVLLDP